MSGAARDRAFASLRSALREILLGRQLSLGLGHGDLWAGNLFYEAGGTAPHDVRISGLIDWDTARKDAPEGWDAGHMAITLRMSKNTEELGPAISALLREGAWSDEEYRQFAEAGLGGPLCRGGDPELQWALVILIWLHHVSAGVAKADGRARNRLWCTANVDRVLLAACNTPPWSRHVEG